MIGEISLCSVICLFFFFKQKTAYEMRISDWSSDVCSSDLRLDQRGFFPRSYLDSGFIGIDGDAIDERHEAHFLAARDQLARHLERDEIGRASCRERVCQYV